MALNDLDVVYDDKAFGNIIDPTQWNTNFKLIETITNANNVIVNGHLVNFVNPHQVTKIQVGLANVDDVKQATKAEFDAFVVRTDNPHAVTKGQVGLSNLTNNAQATKIEFDLHIARTDNPHTVTAAQVNAYTKAEMQTTGQAALHWGNLTNVPNMADASWKSAVATPANLPITGNTLLDQRIVLNDGDGKQAMYSCVATTGDWDAQWDKIADVDFAGDEATRVTQENARVSAEGLRVTAEGLRVTADSGRTTAEGGRVTAESGRVNAELSRVTIENGRVSTEGLRATAEGLRATAEGNRVNAEGLRVTADGNRTTAEGLRAVAEVNRANAESSRVTSNNAMVFIGEYDAGTAYVVGNQVTYLGSTYRNILNGTNKIPTNETYWVLVASKGADGLGAGDMLKATYDTTANGVVDNAERVNNLTVETAVPEGALFTDTVPTTANIGTLYNSAIAKTTLVDADIIGAADSAASFVLNKWTFANLKTQILSYLTTVTTTWTNKRITKRVGTLATGTLAPLGDTQDMYTVTALASNTTISAPTGTPTNGQELIIRIKDNGTARTLTWNAIFRSMGVVLPTTTIASKTIYCWFIYNSTDSKWDLNQLNIDGVPSGITTASGLPIVDASSLFTATNVEDALTETAELVSTSNLIFINKVVATADFISDSTYANYPHKAVIACAGITSSYFADVAFNVVEATSGNYSPVSLTGANTVTIYAIKIPSAFITIPAIKCTKEVS